MTDIINYYKENYKKGDKVMLKKMSGEGSMPYGLMGIVNHVDDAGQIHVSWENGSSLALVPVEDEWVKLNSGY